MKVNFSTPVNQLSYGLSGLSILKAAARHGHEFALFPLGPLEVSPEDTALVNEALVRSSSYDRVAPSLRLYHQFALSQHVGKGEHIGWPIFELDAFSAQELHHLRQMDRLFVCSGWAKKVLNTHGMTNVNVVPLGVDLDIFSAPTQPPPPDKTVFLTVGKFEVRKGHPELIDAFNRAFTPADDVLLLMMCANPFLPPEEIAAWVELAEKTPMGGHIKVLTNRFPDQKCVSDIMACTHCGVFPTRAEGFCLPIAELLAMGKQVIATDYSGHSEFCTATNTRFIHVDDFETAYDGRWFHGTGRWARLGEGQMDQLVAHLREIHLLRREGASLLNEDGINTMKRFTWDNTVRVLEEALA